MQMKYNENNKPLVCMMTNNVCYKSTKKMKVRGVCWHDTACNNTAIKRYVQPSDDDPNKDELLKILGKNIWKNDWNHTNKQAGVNAFVGKLKDGTVSTVQTMPWDFRPWGVGKGSKGSINDGWIQFEICQDNKKHEDYAKDVYKEACEITAYLCKMFDIDPYGTEIYNGVRVPTICCHGDATRLQVGDSHIDIYDWFPTFNLTMETARDDVALLLKGAGPSPTPKPTPNQITINQPPTIRNGSRGDTVKVWQSIIGVSVDGKFGTITEDATKEFQKQHSIEVDGIVGKNSWTCGLNDLK